MPGRRNKGCIRGRRAAPIRCAAPMRSRIPQATRNGNKEGNTFVSQSCTPSAEAASISSGKQSRAKIRKQAQPPNSKVPFFMQSLP